jgi:hypothetical protein
MGGESHRPQLLSPAFARVHFMLTRIDTDALYDEVRLPLQSTAKHYLRLLWGDQGPPADASFEDLDALTRQIGATLADQLLQQALDRQAFTAPSNRSELIGCASTQSRY